MLPLTHEYQRRFLVRWWRFLLGCELCTHHYFVMERQPGAEGEQSSEFSRSRQRRVQGNGATLREPSYDDPLRRYQLSLLSYQGSH